MDAILRKCISLQLQVNKQTIIKISKMYTEVLCIFAIFLAQSFSTYVKPQTFLDSRLAKGTWIHKNDVVFGSDHLFEGGWVWTPSGNLQVTHICRAKTRSFPDVSIEPGELLNDTCYVSVSPSIGNPSGVQGHATYDVLMKTEDEVYEWQNFNKNSGDIPIGTIIGGIGTHYEPIMICRKFFNGTAGELRKSKAVLGKFNAKDGRCFYEQEIGGSWIKWDLSFATEDFQLLVLRARGEEKCAEPRSRSLNLKLTKDQDKPSTSHIKKAINSS